MRRPSISRTLTSTLLSLSLLAGCAGSHETTAGLEEATGTAEQAVSGLPNVTVYDSGSWDTVTDCGMRGISYQCFYVGRFWVDLSVANLAYDKAVGIVWTDDGWTTQHTSYAGYKQSLGGGREKWGLDVTFFGGYTPSYGRTVEYAVFATQDGQTAWDPLDNHFINHGELDLAQPIQVLSTSFSYDPARGGTVMDSTVRVLNLAYQKQVTLRVTSDGWQTFRDLDATWQTGNDFAVTVPSLGMVPGQVEYAVRYRVAGAELWDNNNGQNYLFDVAPHFQESTWADLKSGAAGVSGNYSPYVWLSGLLPVSTLTCSLDGAPLAACDDWIYGTGGGATGYLSTAGLTDGAHLVTFNAGITGGYQTSYDIPFTVQNRVTVSAPWQPRSEATPPAPAAMASDSAGALFVLYGDGSVTRHDGFGQAATLLVPGDPGLAVGSGVDLAVDSQGRIYVLWNADGSPVVRRYLADGSADATFGSAGAASLGVYRYSVARLGLAGGNAYVMDTAQGVISGLDASGNVLADQSLGSATYGTGFCGDGQSLWLVTQTGIEQYQPGATGLALLGSTPVSTGPYAPSVACAGGALTLLGNGQLYAVDAGGGLTSLWNVGGYSSYELPGKLDDRSPIVRMDDGSVLGLQQGRIDRFARLP